MSIILTNNQTHRKKDRICGYQGREAGGDGIG